MSTLRFRARPELCNGQGDWTGWAEHFESGRAVNRWKEPESPVAGCCTSLTELLGHKKRWGEDWAATVEDLKMLVVKS